MDLLLGIVFIAAGIFLPLAAYYDKVGQFGFGSPAAIARKRALTRSRAFIAGPLIFVIGIIMLVEHAAG